MTSTLQRRARDMRGRLAIRAWEYRQLTHAKGAWFRLRRLLVDARGAWVITDQEATQLIADGLRPEPVGEELIPAKRIIVITEDRLAGLANRQEIPVRLNAALLSARNLALVRFATK